MANKTCTGCGETKPLDGGFHRDKGKKDGRSPHCKDCSRSRKADYYRENREQILAQQAIHRTKPEVKKQRAEYGASYYARPEVRARNSAYKADYYRENRDAVLARAAKYRADNCDSIRAYQADHYRTNPHLYWESRYRSKARRYGFEPVVISFTREELTSKWGHDCVHCGGPFESLDHYPEPISRGGAHSLDNCRPSCNACQAHSWRPGFTPTNTSIKENN